ncbi:hypothetical protein NLG97_g1521 [Lecanicillium saksenae]|uniref:Uncharacterized protein n=1 Tax=Lecanicillium saksenae TaxID=468837 RepID=A0ACC1R589_9HYPO|nr:hypothetical protein NLG97_g1521 [Lecanicillium saksenae]
MSRRSPRLAGFALSKPILNEQPQRSYLPPEIWLLICDHLSKRGVFNLSRTEKAKYRLLQTSILRHNVKEKGTSCLPYFASRGDLEKIRLLKSYPGVQADARNHDGDTALLCAIDEGFEAVSMALLEIPGEHVNMRSARRGWRPLTLAITKKQEVVVRKLLECDNINANGVRCTDYGTPLFSAVRSHQSQIVRLLLAVPGIDVAVTDGHGQTALHLAAIYRDRSIVQILLEDGRVPRLATDGYGRSALDYAFLSGNSDVIEAMYTHGLRLDSRHIELANLADAAFEAASGDDARKNSSLCECAAARGHLGLFSQLLPSACDTTREKSLLLAASSGRTKMVEFALEYMSPLFYDHEGNTPASRAIARGKPAYVFASSLGHLIVDQAPRTAESAKLPTL